MPCADRAAARPPAVAAPCRRHADRAVKCLPVGLLLALSLSLGIASSAAPLTVRVGPRAGAPCLLVDGQPVRARMFWGAPNNGTLPADPTGTLRSFEFTAAADSEQRGTLHLRFGHRPGDVWIDNLRIVDVDSGRDVLPPCDFEQGEKSLPGKWVTWPTGPQNTVGTVDVSPGAGEHGSAALHVRLAAPADGRWPDFHVYSLPNLALTAGRKYRVSLWLRAKPERKVQIAVYRPGEPFVQLGSPPSAYESQIALAAAAEVPFVSFPIGMPWPEPGKPEVWSGVDAACEAVLRVNPRALLLPRVPCDPPPWWRKAHPEAVMQFDDGARGNCAVVADATYRRECAARLHALVTHLEEKFGTRIAGYHPCGQNTGEWFYEDTWKRPLNGYAPADRDTWRAWLQSHYADDTGLRKAWGDDRVTLAAAEVPTPAARRAAPTGLLRWGPAQRPLVDFAQYQQEAMADCVCALAHAVRAASHGQKLVVFFYGYVFEFGAVHNGPSIAGHYALARVRQSPDIDVLCSPISYFDRGLGESGPAMTAAESIALAGKMWLYEDDTSTYLSTGQPPGSQQRVKDLAETVALLRRNTAQCALRNFGTWWMDLGASGWFDDAGMWAEMTRLRPLDAALLETPRPFRPEVAAIIDEPSMLAVPAGGEALTRPAIYEVRRPLGRMGAPYGQYLLDDVTAARVDAKLYVFLNAWSLTPQRRTALRAATLGKAAVWCYAPGFLDQEAPAPPAMRELTGFTLRQVSPPKALAEPTDAGRKLGLREAIGVPRPIEPLFAATDATGDEVLATYADGSPAVALRRSGTGLSLFVGPPGLTSELLRAAARAAGVHLYTAADCNVVSNGPFLLLHAAQEGPLEVDVGRRGPVRDLESGELVGEGPRFSLPIGFGATRVLRIP